MKLAGKLIAMGIVVIVVARFAYVSGYNIGSTGGHNLGFVEGMRWATTNYNCYYK